MRFRQLGDVQMKKRLIDIRNLSIATEKNSSTILVSPPNKEINLVSIPGT